MADYVAFERARACRRLLVTRFGLLALFLGIIGLGFHLFGPLVAWLGIGLCAAAPTWAWIAELRCDWKLARRLEELPGGASHLVLPRPRKKVIKSS
jgi:hypothetical protein